MPEEIDKDLSWKWLVQSDLKMQIEATICAAQERFWSLKKVEVVPVVVGALRCISKGFSRWMDTLGIKLNVGMVQKSALFGTTTILRKVLDM